jgi:hypothetical protein
MAIELNDKATPEDVGRLVDVLESAPSYVQSIETSSVRRNLSALPCDLLWEHTFRDLDGYMDYRVHPYHCNLIDELLGRESLRAIHAQVFSLFFDDTERLTPRPHIPPDRKWAAESVGRGNNAHTGPITLVEQIDVEAGCRAAYLDLFERDYLPLAIERGMHLVGIWQSAPEAGPDEEIVVVWLIEGGWREWDVIRAKVIADPRVHAWYGEIAGFVKDVRRRLLEPVGIA